MIVMFGMTELSATMVLLPAGLPNFAQRLLNQMHYARDQQVIASCLILIGFFLFIDSCFGIVIPFDTIAMDEFMLLIFVLVFSL